MISPARVAAFDALRRADPHHGTGQDLASALVTARYALADARDRALATELALGVERWRLSLDTTIAASARRDAVDIDFPALIALRLALFQLRYLTRTPPHAVVDDAVELTRRNGAPRAAGFVNGVLRGLLRGNLELGIPARPGSTDSRDAWEEYISIALSHPAWLVRRWIERHGPEAADAWAQFDNTPAPVTLRVNTRRTTADAVQSQLEREGITTVPAAHAPHALVATDGNPLATSLVDEGDAAVMDESSQLVGALAASVLRGTTLDACAAPGGKTLILACDRTENGLLVAADRRPKRLTLLRRTLDRLGLGDVSIVAHDLSRGTPFAALDGILIDAPCSGLGTLRRDPDIRWRRREEDLPALAAAQLEMLAQAAGALAPGGRLVYATCSSEPEENETVVETFLARQGGFERVRPEGERFGPFLDMRGDFRTLPFRDRLEAFYAAVLTRTREP